MEYEENSYLVAAVCLVGAMTAVAAGQVKTAISSSSHAEDFTEYSQLAEKEEQLGLKNKGARGIFKRIPLCIWYSCLQQGRG